MKHLMRRVRGAVLIAFLSVFGAGASAQDFITLASTSSTQNSGLYDAILPQFTAQTGIEVRIVALGTGQAIKIAQNGDADVLLVHHRESEDAFIAGGYGVARYDVMYNDFVLIGRASDSGSDSGGDSGEGFRDKFDSLAQVFAHFFNTESAVFISRGDASGTHKKEREIWARLGLSPSGAWYKEIGAGMGAALNMVATLNGSANGGGATDGTSTNDTSVPVYTLSDRGTWLSFGNKNGLAVVWENEPELQNPYGIIALNPARFAHVKHAQAARFIDWITSAAGQSAIAEFRVDGKQLFCPNAKGLAITRPRINGECPSDLPTQ